MDKSAGEYITEAPRIEQEKRGCIRVSPSGRYVNPLKVRARDIDFRDIAHHLSLICRYTGASPVHYSVGQHSLLVSSRLLYWGAPAPLQLAGLLHDAGEYLFNDLASPVKRDPRMKWYCDMEHACTQLIFCCAGLDPALLPMTKEADDAVFKDEAATFFKGADIVHPNLYPEATERAFMARFEHLHGVVNG